MSSVQVEELREAVRPAPNGASTLYHEPSPDPAGAFALDWLVRADIALRCWPPSLAYPKLLRGWLILQFVVLRLGALLFYMLVAALAAALHPLLGFLAGSFALVRWCFQSRLSLRANRRVRQVLPTFAGLEPAALDRIKLGYEPTAEQLARAVRCQQRWKRRAQSTPESARACSSDKLS